DSQRDEAVHAADDGGRPRRAHGALPEPRRPDRGAAMSVQARIFGSSFVGLFLELLLIRYLAVELRFFAFFKNFVLMAAFLGLGVGLGLTRRRDLMPSFIPVTGALLLIALFAN